MELYEYKMTSMVHAERAAQASLEAANQLVTHLQHRLAQMSTEVSRLHQLLFHTQQCNEEAQKQLRMSTENFHKLSAKYVYCYCSLQTNEARIQFFYIQFSRNSEVIFLFIRYTKEEIRNKELSKQIYEKDKDIEKMQGTVGSLENKLSDLSQIKKTLTKKYESQCEKNMTLVTGAEKLENCVKMLNNKIQEKTEEVTKANFRIDQMAKVTLIFLS